jgi:hypothetical protein
MPELSRRDMVRAGAGTAVAVVAGSGVFLYSPDGTVRAAGLTADDVTVTSNDGELTTLTIAPDVTVSWDGQEAAVAEVHATWKVKTQSTSETTVGSTPYTIKVSDPSKSGSVDHTFNDINLLSTNGGSLSASNFEAASDGGSETTEVTISMDVTLKDADSNTIASKTDVLGPANYTVEVNNANSTVSSSGTANTSGS